MNGHGIALPRILTRRRKPRPPAWRKAAAWCALWLLLFALNLLEGNALAAASSAIFFACYWRELHRAPADPEAPPLTLRERQTMAATMAAACGLMMVGVFV